jgi:glutathione peroxidase
MKHLFYAALAACAILPMTAVRADSLYDIPLKDIHGAETTLAPYKGKVLLVVNVASKCGHTPQYQALEAAYKRYSAQGFEVVAFPCNQFMGQEPGSDAQIEKFCKDTYGVTFPLFDKIDVNGPDRSPLYTALVGPGAEFPGDIKWNFTKILIGRDGKELKRFEPTVEPSAPEVTSAIEAALAAK